MNNMTFLDDSSMSKLGIFNEVTAMWNKQTE